MQVRPNERRATLTLFALLSFDRFFSPFRKTETRSPGLGGDWNHREKTGDDNLPIPGPNQTFSFYSLVHFHKD